MQRPHPNPRSKRGASTPKKRKHQPRKTRVYGDSIVHTRVPAGPSKNPRSKARKKKR